MATPYKCPLCHGIGTTDKPGNWAYVGPNGETAPQETCKGCNGHGIVWG